jgi:hypothetical protein
VDIPMERDEHEDAGEIAHRRRSLDQVTRNLSKVRQGPANCMSLGTDQGLGTKLSAQTAAQRYTSCTNSMYTAKLGPILDQGIGHVAALGDMRARVARPCTAL